MSSEAKTLFEKVWEQHVVVEPKGEPTVLYVDLQLLHEVTSPQAFTGTCSETKRYLSDGPQSNRMRKNLPKFSVEEPNSVRNTREHLKCTWCLIKS